MNPPFSILRNILKLNFLFFKYNLSMKTVKLFEYDIADTTPKEALDTALRLIEGNRPAQIVTINPEMVNYAFKNPEFSNLLKDADILLPDGIGIKVAAGILGHKINRIPGIDFAYKLLLDCEKSSIPVALIGTNEEILTKTIENIKKNMPDLKIVYTRNGFFENEEEIYKDLQNTIPKLVLVALGSPKQEYFILGAKKYLKNGLLIGIGGSFDVWAGEIKRAPVIFQKLGLEWFYRVITQPERIKRIFPAIPVFLFRVIGKKLGV